MLLIQADKQMTKPPATVPKMCLLAMAGGALVLVCYISIFKASPLIMLIAQQTRVVFARESDRSIPWIFQSSLKSTEINARLQSVLGAAHLTVDMQQHTSYAHKHHRHH